MLSFVILTVTECKIKVVATTGNSENNFFGWFWEGADALFLAKIREMGYESVAFIGMAKNVGKTVALNHLLRECFLNNCRTGIVSIGRDGERIDAWSGTKKPGIWATENTIIAAAQQAITNSGASLEIVENLGITSSLGSVYLARVRRSGYVEIATTPSAQKIKKVICAMKMYGAELVLVDGALDRASSAAPGVTESTILATGASVHRQADVVVRKTVSRVQQLLIPGVNNSSDGLSPSLLEKIKQSKASMIIGEDEDSIIVMDKIPLGYDKKILPYLKQNRIKVIYIDGAVLDSLLNLFTACCRELTDTMLLVRQGTNILVEEVVWGQYLRAHGYIRTVNPIRLLGVTSNPVSPQGELFFPEDLVKRLSEEFKGLNLITADVKAGIYRT